MNDDQLRELAMDMIEDELGIIIKSPTLVDGYMKYIAYNRSDEMNDKNECEHKTGHTIRQYGDGCHLWQCEWGCMEYFINVDVSNGISHDFPVNELGQIARDAYRAKYLDEVSGDRYARKS